MPDPNYPTSLLDLYRSTMPQRAQQPGMMPLPYAPRPGQPQPGMAPLPYAPQPGQPQPQMTPLAYGAPSPQQPDQQRTIYNDPRMRQQVGQFGLGLLGPQRYL